MCVNSNWIDAQKTSQGKREASFSGGEGVEPNSPRKALRFIKQSSLFFNLNKIFANAWAKMSLNELKWTQMSSKELEWA